MRSWMVTWMAVGILMAVESTASGADTQPVKRYDISAAVSEGAAFLDVEIGRRPRKRKAFL